ncbi:MAG TPA: SRPBCC family protein, partial [Anaerolineales bacterium]|nr:SRPBCC family protein [Anaerolineales bacterium]
MIEFEKSVFIQRSPQEVFDVLTDPPKSTQWQSGVKSAEWITEGPTGVGSTFKSRNRFLGRDL